MIEVYFTWYRCWCCFDKKILMIGVWQPLSLIYANQLGFTDVWFSNSNLSLIRPWLHCGKTRGQGFFDLLIMMLNAHAQSLVGQRLGFWRNLLFRWKYWIFSIFTRQSRWLSLPMCSTSDPDTSVRRGEDVNVSNKYESFSESQH